jgi:hypothetical protein
MILFEWPSCIIPYVQDNLWAEGLEQLVGDVGSNCNSYRVLITFICDTWIWQNILQVLVVGLLFVISSLSSVCYSVYSVIG